MTGYIGIGGTAKKIKNIYIGVGGTAKQVKKAYIGVNGVAQLWYSSQREWVWDVYAVNSGYNLIEGESSSGSGYGAFYAGTSYTLNQSTGEFTVEQTTQIARSSTGATNAVGKYVIDTYSSSGTYTGSTVYLITAASYSWLSGLSLTVTPYTSQYYENRGSLVGSVTDLDVTAYPMNGIQNRYWYVLRNDIARMAVSYTGSYVDQCVQMNDGPYRLLTLIGSGTLSLDSEVEADVWLCGAGDGGTSGSSSGEGSSGGGGGGGYTSEEDGIEIQNLTVVIGAGGTSGGASSISGDITMQAAQGKAVKPSGSSYYYADGGSGGGRGQGSNSNYYLTGRGDGIAKTPFGDSYFPYPFCDGGGGGNYNKTRGGDGGTNGGNGVSPSLGTDSNYGGLGGGHYGGRGGYNWGKLTQGNNIDPTPGTGYGSGGGGSGASYDDDDGYTHGDYSKGTGYQGVCFIRIPL